MEINSVNITSLKMVKEASALYSCKITSPKAAYDLAVKMLHLTEEPVEKFGVITLNVKNDTAGIHIISTGTVSACMVHPRSVFQYAFMNNASSIIAFHNHPSGDPTPSPEDLKVTRQLAAAGKLLGVELLDHIIIGDDGRFTSLKEQGHAEFQGFAALDSI